MAAVASLDILKNGLIEMEMSNPINKNDIQNIGMSNEVRIYYQKLQRDYAIFC